MSLADLLNLVTPGTMLHIVFPGEVIHSLKDQLDIASSLYQVKYFFSVYDELIIVCD